MSSEALSTVLSKLNFDAIFAIAQQAGDAVMAVKQGGQIDIETKSDDTPVTNADKASHAIIDAELQALNLGWPIISEEGHIPEYDERKDWPTFWLVDPVDGTQEFINGTDRYGINIALVHDGRPVFGLMYFPERQLTFYATKGQGAFVMEGDKPPEALPTAQPVDTNKPLRIIGTAKKAPESLTPILDEWSQTFAETEWVCLSSPLKFGWVAWGKADVYPRFGPSCEWDTAPPDIIYQETGRTIVEYPSRSPILYNKRNFSNEWFVCGAKALCLK